MSHQGPDKLGRVILIGAGPGDPGLVTVRGAEYLQMADVVLYDYLVAPELLDVARDNAELICLGRHGHGRLWSQQEINQRLVAEARQGHTVVRLKGGDPAIFGRIAEELAALSAAGITFEIVPGISAALAAPGYAGIPLTDRDVASAVTFVAGRESDENLALGGIDYAALAQLPGTLVFYMGVTTAPTWSRALLAAGKPAETPVAVIRRCTLPDQQTILGTLAEIPEILAPGRLRPPAVIVVGEVARRPAHYQWFTGRPLFGQKVLVTRPAHQASSMATRLAQLGAQVICQPAIEIGPPSDWSIVDAVIERLAQFDWLVFSSSNGVAYFLNRIRQRGRDTRALGGVRIAAIGPATSRALAAYALASDLSPSSYRAEALAEALAPLAKGQRFLLLRASRGREVLSEMLSAAGGQVEQVVVYTSRDTDRFDDDTVRALERGEVGWVTVSSSAIARSLVNVLGDSLHHTKLAAISPLTADVLRENGLEPAVVADDYTSDGLIDAIVAGSRQ